MALKPVANSTVVLDTATAEKIAAWQEHTTFIFNERPQRCLHVETLYRTPDGTWVWHDLHRPDPYEAAVRPHELWHTYSEREARAWFARKGLDLPSALQTSLNEMDTSE